MPGQPSWFHLEIALRAAAAVGRRRIGRLLQRAPQGTDLFLCVVDHFEPQHGRPPRSVAGARLEEWLRGYAEVAGRHRDSEGRPPPHSYFYPWDEFDENEFIRLVEHCAGGWGEIDLHLHHRDDTEATLRREIREAVGAYSGYGALSRWPDGRPAFGFVHGDWALNNSRQDLGRNYCGVNHETALLADEGCYADFTFPAWRHTAQPRQVNSLYFAVSTPLCPKGHDRGEPARVGKQSEADLLLIQGPLVPYLRRGSSGYRLAVDDADLSAANPYRPRRLDRWVSAGLGVEGRPDRVFVKLHTHGAPDANRRALLDRELEALFSDAEARYNDGRRYRLHYVTAREMFNVIRATIEEPDLPCSAARHYLLPAPSWGRLEAARTASPREDDRLQDEQVLRAVTDELPHR